MREPAGRKRLSAQAAAKGLNSSYLGPPCPKITKSEEGLPLVRPPTRCLARPGSCQERSGDPPRLPRRSASLRLLRAGRPGPLPAPLPAIAAIQHVQVLDRGRIAAIHPVSPKKSMRRPRATLREGAKGCGQWTETFRSIRFRQLDTGTRGHT